MIKQNRNLRSHRHGFTLIEALVTIVVLVVMLPVIVQGFNLASKAAIHTRQRAEATAFARSTMDMLVSTGDWQNGNFTDEETHRATTYEVEATLNNWEEADNQQLVDLQRLDVTVRWTFEYQPEEITLSTVVYLPNVTSTTSAPGGGESP